MHENARGANAWRESPREIEGLREALATRVMSAHVMGGCAMGRDPKRSARRIGRHHQLGQPLGHDGSVFPTSVAANPQLSIYATSARSPRTSRRPRALELQR